MSLPRKILATWFGSGLSPVGPGTAGTLATLPLLYLLWWVGGLWVQLAAIAAVSVSGLWAASRAREDFGSEDPGRIVIDEAAGFLVAAFGLVPGWPALLGAFVLFRAADIAKPWPVCRLERLPGAWGIMADDLAAGVYANLCWRGLVLLWSGWG